MGIKEDAARPRRLSTSRGLRGENAAGGEAVAVAVIHRGAMELRLALATGQTADVRKRPRRVYRINRSAKRVTAKQASRSASATEGVGVPVSVCHLLGKGEREVYLVHRIEPVAGGARLDPGSASRSGRALIP